MVGIENANGGQAMDHRDFRILGLAASLRRASFHRGIIRAAHEVAPEWMSCEGFDLARIPYFNQDIEDQGIPESVKELREKIRDYDAVLIATPEYDYAIPGVLTAALDWCLRSRYDPTPFRHKPVGIVGASPGGGGTLRSIVPSVAPAWRQVRNLRTPFPTRYSPLFAWVVVNCCQEYDRNYRASLPKAVRCFILPILVCTSDRLRLSAALNRLEARWRSNSSVFEETGAYLVR